VRVLLLEGKDRVLGDYPPKLSAAAKRALEKRHVEVRLNTKVTNIDAHGVTVTCGGAHEQIGARTVLWAAGVQASPLAASLGVARDRAGRVEVQPDLSVPGRPEIFVIGDLAAMISDGKQVPGVAQGAIQGGRHAAAIIAAEARGQTRPRPAFRYHDKGSMATIGRGSAVAMTKRVAISGMVAWLGWWAVHIAVLVGFRNRVIVMLQWAWSWVTFQRGARLITGPVPALPAVHEGAHHRGALPAAAAAIEPVLQEQPPPP
jgi:NADH dehydrogenase